MGLNLESTISLNSASFERGMHKVANSVGSSIKQFAIGAIGVYTLEKAFYSTIETSKELVNESKRMGVTVEQLQVMRKAASGANVEMDALATTMEKLNTFRGKALGGGSESATALKQAAALGISPEMLKSSSAQDILFNAIGKKLKEVNPQTIAAPLREVLGRGYGQLVPLLTKDMDALQKKMESLGMIISTKTAFELKEFDTQINSIKNILVSALAPAMVSFAEFILDTFTGSGILGKAVEGLIFKFQELTGNSDLNGYTSKNGEEFSAKQRADAASEALTLMQQNKKAGDFRAALIAQENQPLTPDDHASAIRPGIFGDMPAGGQEKMFHYFQGLIQPVADASNQAGKKSTETMDGLRALIQAFKDSYKKGAVQPLDFTPLEGAQAKGGRTESDALVRVGNFLGSNIGAVHSAARMEQYSKSTVELLRGVNQTLKTIQIQLPKSNFNGNGSLDGRMKNGASAYSGIMSLMDVPNQ